MGRYWTPEEDEMLMKHIRKIFGNRKPGDWKSVANNSGLAKKGKGPSSCRLRWFHHLMPGIEKEAFTVFEILWILKRHSDLGDNAWSTIANELPGRTDNMIKNFWHTHVVGAVRELNRDNNRVTYQQIMTRILMKINQAAAAAGGSGGYDENQAHYIYALLAEPFQDNGGVVDAAAANAAAIPTLAYYSTITASEVTTGGGSFACSSTITADGANTGAQLASSSHSFNTSTDHHANMGAADSSGPVDDDWSLMNVFNHLMN